MTGKIALQCESCRFKFKRREMPKLCPNCGRDNLVESSATGAEQILRELDDLERGL